MPLQTNPAPSPRIRRSWSPFIGGLVPALLSLVFYLPALGNGFAWDDLDHVAKNPWIRTLDLSTLKWMFTNRSGSYWMPLTWLSFWLDQAWGGLQPLHFHATNILLHALNTYLVFRLTYRLIALTQKTEPAPEILRRGSLGLPTAFLTSLLFGLHPLHVESVAWIMERKDVLYASFYLGGLLAYLGYATQQSHRTLRLTATWVLFLLALMSKPMAVTFPLALWVLDYYPLRRTRPLSAPNFLEKALFLLPALLLGLSMVRTPTVPYAYSMTRDLTPLFRFMNACRSLLFYPFKMALPINLSPLVPFPATGNAWPGFQYPLSVLAVGLLTYVLWRVRDKRPWLLAAWAYYILSLVPVLGILQQAGSQAAADRYTYLPCLGFFMPISAWVASKFLDRKGLGRLGYGILALVLGTLTLQQIKVWKDSQSVFERVVALYPDRDPWIHINLADLYVDQNRTGDALREYARAAALPPIWAQARALAGHASVLAGMGQTDLAFRELQEAVGLDPNCAPAHQDLWVLYGRGKKYREALAEIRAAIVVEPGNPENFNKLALTYDLMGDSDGAVTAYETCIQLDPKNTGYWANLGTEYMKNKSWLQAIPAYQRALDLQPGNAGLHGRLAQAYSKVGETRLALEQARLAKRPNAQTP